MGILLFGLILFFAVHSISIAQHRWRMGMVDKLGLFAWQGIYSLVAIIGLVSIIWGYGLARVEPIVVYSAPGWLRYISMVLLIPVFPLLLATYLPGKIQLTLKHPMLVAIKLWALAHLLVNGTLADIVLFGSFLAWAVVDRISLKRRTLEAVPQLPSSKANDAISIVVGLLLYVGFVAWGHEWLLGVAVIPH